MRKALVLAATLAVAVMGAAPVRAAPAGAVAWGCSVAGTAALGAAVAINGQTLVNVVTGAVVAPLSPALLYGGLTAIMVSSVCALGYHVVPVASPAPAPAVLPSGGRRIAQLDP